MENVSWLDCRDFMNAVNERVAGLELQLPTEAQWEYACRAGTATPFSYGENITANQVIFDGRYPYADGKKGEYRAETVDVGSLPPNPWGLYEMHGNVWEWCEDGHREYQANSEVDPIGPEGDARVMRGGSWGSSARSVRSAYRNAIHRGSRLNVVGFRCARVQEE